MREHERYDDALRGEIMNTENESDFFVERHPPSSEEFGGDNADLNGVDRSESDAVKECGGHERFGSEILIRMLFTLAADHQARHEYDRENAEYRFDGRRYGLSEISESLKEIEGQENDRDAERRFHSYRKGNVRFGYGGGIEICHSGNLTNDIRNPRQGNQTSEHREKDLIFDGYSAESPTRSRSSTDRIWPSEG